MHHVGLVVDDEAGPLPGSSSFRLDPICEQKLTRGAAARGVLGPDEHAIAI